MRFMLRAVQQALNNILRNKSVNFLCLGIIAFTLLVPGIFNFISFHLDRYISRLSENIEAIFYIRDNSDAAGIETLMQRIEGSLLVKEVGFTSREQARAELRQGIPRTGIHPGRIQRFALPGVDRRQLPLRRPQPVQIESFIRDMRRNSLVESVQLNMDWARKIAMIKKFASFVGLFLSAILLIVSIFIIFNVVKINIFYRKDEINILRLVGATDWYIKIPFLLEGLILGLLGGLLAGGLLLLTIKAFPLYAGFVYQVVKQLIDFRELPLRIFWQLVITGSVIGLFSSFISLRRFIKHTPK